MIAAGVNAKALSTYMGHANIAITLDRYGHLMPGAEAEAARAARRISRLRARALCGAGPRPHWRIHWRIRSTRWLKTA